MDERDFNEKMKEINLKLKNNPDLIDQINDHIFKIEEILETAVQVNILFFENFHEHIEEVNDSLFIEEKNLDDTITLKKFLDALNVKDEEMDYKILFDPIYLKKGLNEISNVLITNVADKLIIVPKAKENEKE